MNQIEISLWICCQNRFLKEWLARITISAMTIYCVVKPFYDIAVHPFCKKPLLFRNNSGAKEYITQLDKFLNLNSGGEFLVEKIRWVFLWKKLGGEFLVEKTLWGTFGGINSVWRELPSCLFRA